MKKPILTGNQSSNTGHYTKEKNDRKFKAELKRRNDLDAEIERGNALVQLSIRNLRKWEINKIDENTGFFNEVAEMVKAKLELINANEMSSEGSRY